MKRSQTKKHTQEEQMGGNKLRVEINKIYAKMIHIKKEKHHMYSLVSRYYLLSQSTKYKTREAKYLGAPKEGYIDFPGKRKENRFDR